MLVAVAAMGFVACQNEPEIEVNGGNKQAKYTVDVIADIENTRSGFSGKDGNVYKTQWDGGESITYYAEDYVSYQNTSGTVNLQLVDGSGRFSVSVNDPTGVLYLGSPASAVELLGYGYSTITVPAEQTPRAESVDPAAHILTAKYDGYSDGLIQGVIKPYWQHEVAYARMQIKNFEPTIDFVEVSIGSTTIKLNPDNVVNNVFWFACKENTNPSTVKVKITADDAETYTKTLDLVNGGNGNGLPFLKGEVAEFGVNMSGVAADSEGGGGEGGGSGALEVDYLTNTLTRSGYWQFSTNGADPYIRVYMNSNDTPNNNSFVAKTYTFEQSQTNPSTGIFSINRYNIDGSTTFGSNITSGDMTISVVNGKYRVVITATLWNGTSTTWGYEGLPDGWPVPGGGTEPDPDDPEQLAQPTGLASANVTSESFDISWTAVANALSYNVSLNGGAPQNVTGTSYSFTGLTAETAYTVSVVAVGDGVSYTNSEAATLSVTTSAAAVTPDPGDSNVLTSAKCFGMYYDMVPYYEFRSADGQNILNVTIYQNPTRIFAYEYSYTSSINDLARYPNTYFTSGSNYSGNCTINGVSGIVIASGSTINVTESQGDGMKHKIEFHIVTTGDQTHDFTFEGVIVDAR